MPQKGDAEGSGSVTRMPTSYTGGPEFDPAQYLAPGFIQIPANADYGLFKKLVSATHVLDGICRVIQ